MYNVHIILIVFDTNLIIIIKFHNNYYRYSVRHTP